MVPVASAGNCHVGNDGGHIETSSLVVQLTPFLLLPPSKRDAPPMTGEQNWRACPPGAPRLPPAANPLTWLETVLQTLVMLVGGLGVVAHCEVTRGQDIKTAESVGLAEGVHLLHEGARRVSSGNKDWYKRGTVLRTEEEVAQQVLRVVREQ